MRPARTGPPSRGEEPGHPVRRTRLPRPLDPVLTATHKLRADRYEATSLFRQDRSFRRVSPQA